MILQQWVRTCSTEGGLLVARQRTRQKPLLVAQMVEEWLNHYRRIALVFFYSFYVMINYLIDKYGK